MKNTFARNVFDHLTTGDSADRSSALKDLIDRKVFSDDVDDRVCRRIVEDYISENPRGFCPEGINRFKKAVGIKDPEPVRRTAVLEVEIELGPDWDHSDAGILEERPFTPESVIASDIRNVLRRQIVKDHGDGYSVVKADLVKIGKVVNHDA